MVVGWGGDLKQQVPLCVHTRSLHSHLVSLDAENLSQPHTKNISFSFPLQKPSETGAALLAFSFGQCGQGRGWRNDRGPGQGKQVRVLGLGPHWGHTLGSSPESPAPTDTPCLPGAVPDGEALASDLRPGAQAP